ncbi:MAG: helix-hairpin-helix domain-containing protein [Synergistaceae bacterium]|jgi:competence protein ComEA|nr:helix-hairpin-helix domain-containing protein [Synergistaceae bacterium]
MIMPGEALRKRLLVIIGLGCLIGAFALASIFRGGPAAPEPDTDEFVTEGEIPSRPTAGWVVYVTGAVMRPGVYEVPAGSRVRDAVAGAGGFSAHADPGAINLAERIEDGVHIRVPAQDEDERALPKEIGRPTAAVSRPSGRAASVARTGGSARQDDGKAARININRASEGELISLPGVGPKLSGAIVEHRDRNGPFSRTEDLMNVRGIGIKRFEAIKDLVSVSD